jgi:hypothetical protein
MAAYLLKKEDERLALEYAELSQRHSPGHLPIVGVPETPLEIDELAAAETLIDEHAVAEVIVIDEHAVAEALLTANSKCRAFHFRLKGSTSEPIDLD